MRKHWASDCRAANALQCSVMRRSTVALSIAATSLLASTANAQFTKTNLSGTGRSFLRLSGDNKTVLGNLVDDSGRHLLLWKQSSGFSTPIAGQVIACDMSADATTFIGTQLGDSSPCIVYKNGVIAEMSGVTPYRISRDGTTMVALGRSSSRGVIWRAASGPLYLPTIAGRPVMITPFINDDGTSVAGIATDYTGRDYRPVRWTSSNGIQLLPLNPGFYVGTSECMANNGDTIFGTESDYDELRPTVPFRWDESGGTHQLPLFGLETIVRKCSADGSVLFGHYRGANDPPAPSYLEFLWTEQSGYLNLQQYLANNGITGITNINKLVDVSADGRTLLFEDGYLVHIDLPPTIGGIVLPSSATSGLAFNGTVSLDHAVSTQQTVSLVSGNSSLLTVPSKAVIAANQTTSTFPIQTAGVASITSVKVTATYGGVVKSTTLRLVPAVLKSVALKSYNVVGGNAVSGTVLLSGKAPTGGGIVDLTSGNAAVTFSDSSVNVASQASSATFTAITHPVLSSTNVAISGNYNGRTLSNTLMVQPTNLASLRAPAYAQGGNAITVSVLLDGQAQSGGLKVKLVSSEPYLATVPATVTIPYGGSRYSLNVATKPVYQNTPVTFSATYNNKTVSYRVLLTP